MKTLFLQPIKGKYVKCSVDGKTYEVWKVDPRGTQEVYGTEVDYDVAMKILIKYSKLITLTPAAAKDIDKTVLAKIASEQERLKRNLESQSRETVTSSVDEEKVKELETKAKNQETLIASQTEEIKKTKEALEASNKETEGLKKQMVEMQKQIAALTSNNK